MIEQRQKKILCSHGCSLQALSHYVHTYKLLCIYSGNSVRRSASLLYICTCTYVRMCDHTTPTVVGHVHIADIMVRFMMQMVIIVSLFFQKLRLFVLTLHRVKSVNQVPLENKATFL